MNGKNNINGKNRINGKFEHLFRWTSDELKNRLEKGRSISKRERKTIKQLIEGGQDIWNSTDGKTAVLRRKNEDGEGDFQLIQKCLGKTLELRIYEDYSDAERDGAWMCGKGS